MITSGNGHQRYMQMNIPHKYQHQSHQPHHGQHNHHQQNHSGHPGHNAIGHQHTFSSGMLSNSNSNYASSSIQNGSPNDDQADMPENFSENWQEQLQLAAELRQSATAAHRHSRKTGAELHSKGSVQSVTTDSQRDSEQVERNRAPTIAEDQRQDWNGLDLSGQGLRTLSACLFNNYSFLTKLFIDNNKLTVLPSGISALRNLELLQASNNQLRELPDSIGMLVKLKQLLVFDNMIHTLPCQIGHLYRLEMLGVEGNPLDEDIKDILIQQGTQALVVHIRDQTQGMPLNFVCLPQKLQSSNLC